MPNSSGQFRRHKRGFASELAYPTKISLPSRGDGPRCEVVWETGDGPWAMVVILCIDTAEDPPTTEYIECLMPKVYAIPLMMVNKQLAFFESLRTETGAVRELPPERSKLKLGKAIYDAEYDAEAGNQDLGPDWRWPPIHGYLVREHRGWGHNLAQREGYWKDARNSNRIPYEDEIIEDLDWISQLKEGRLKRKWRSYLWACIGQGLGREQTYDAEGWLCWHPSRVPESEQAFEETHGQLEGEEGEAGPSTKRELLESLSRRASSRLQSEVRKCDNAAGDDDDVLAMVEGGHEHIWDEDSDAEEEAVLSMVVG